MQIKRRIVWVALLALLPMAMVIGLVGQRATAQGPEDGLKVMLGKKPVAVIDKPVPDFAFRDMTRPGNKTVRLSDFRNKKVVITVFMANRCGTTWTYEKQIGDLVRDYAKRGVQLLIIHSNYVETDAEIKGQLESRNIAAPVLDDKKTQAYADFMAAAVTPTFAVIDKAGVLRYKGAFDDHHDDSNPYLRPAVEAVLAGRPVKIKTTRAFG